MAKLTSWKRHRLPSSEFALPSKRKYPVYDEAHARNALARVSEYGSPSEQREVRAAVKRRYPSIE